MLGLKPIKLLPARERVASALRKAIIAQQIKEGETLTLETTAQQLGVSITPVREAFQILERDGLISLQQNRGATVLGINEKTLREHYQVRAVLEKAACELCCENGADLSSVKNCIDTAEEALERNDVTDYANQSLLCRRFLGLCSCDRYGRWSSAHRFRKCTGNGHADSFDLVSWL